ncbi:hypothetical protein [Cellulomonas sp. NS3]|uniref:hypothetical protein n=1 Tax=Cellulomonas sp. NS3 TaxID=2973977 RepID=UPI0021619318|nr:hypothetical protein [Cellulomonas sp. NS3]
MQDDRTCSISGPCPILAIYADEELMGTVTLVGGPWVGSPWWAWDVRLREPERLARRMDQHVPGSGHAAPEP